MNQIRNCDFFSRFLRCIPHSQRSRHFQKLRAFSIRIFFHFSLSLRALSLQKETTGENSAIFEQFFSPPLRPLWKKERAFPLPIVPRAIIAFFLLEYPAGASAEERGTTVHFQQNRHFA